MSPQSTDTTFIPGGFTGYDQDDLYKCVHCGFCLQACPTYLQTGLETESPRGRIALMKAVNEGRIGITPVVSRHWDLCIQCRACEVVCPSGVPYGKLIEATMAEVRARRKTGLLAKVTANILLRYILSNQKRLNLLLLFARLYQRLGIQFAIRKSGIIGLLSRNLAELEKSAPVILGGPFKAEGQVIPAQGERRARVALLSGCVMPLIHGPQMESVTRVLTHNGCDVVIPREQVCCGAIHSHSGDLVKARDLAKQNIDAFLAADVDAVVVASAGCSARMKEYDELLSLDVYSRRASDLSVKVKDIHEFLVDLPFVKPTGRFEAKVTYQDPCHLSHAQRITEAPRIILNSIEGLHLIEMTDSSRCCGAGGTYSITQREFSLELLDSKMDTVVETSADVLAVANPGCHIQLANGIVRSRSGMQVRYVTDLLDEAYRRS